MLIKPSTFIVSSHVAVKNLSRAFALSACLGVVGLSTTAQASSPLFERIVQVKIKMSDLEKPNGTSEVYAVLAKKAKRECKADRSALYYTGESVADCTADLLGQLVENSQIESLQSYHQSQVNSETQTLAMNAKLSLQN